MLPSTDEFLSEWTPPANRRLRWATGFSGSVGTAVVLRDSAVLFVDGRYLRQAARETDGAKIQVEPSTALARGGWANRFLRGTKPLGVDPWLHSRGEVTAWRELASKSSGTIEILGANPVDNLWSEGRPAPAAPPVVDYPCRHAGAPVRGKCAPLVHRLRSDGLHAVLIADPEDVSWLLNVRSPAGVLNASVGEAPIVPSCFSRALLWRDGNITWFIEEERVPTAVRERLAADQVNLRSPFALLEALKTCAQGCAIGAYLERTPEVLVSAIETHGTVVDIDVVARSRWRKHHDEVACARKAHVTDAVAVIQFLARLSHIVTERTVTECEAAEMLAQLRSEQLSYLGPSMPMMSASGPSGAEPHYVPRGDSCRRLNDHPIYWMDSGGHYPGGTTDNTVTVALSQPNMEHLRAHTLVLKGLIALATARVPVGTCGYQLDVIARQPLWQEGNDYEHGTGHGVGNFLNIHEGPHIGRRLSSRALAPIEAGMIITDEPGYYSPGDFGVRLESHLLVVKSGRRGFLEFETISRLPIDPRLVNFALLSAAELSWLAGYHCTVLQDVGPRLDPNSRVWLQDIVNTFSNANCR